MRFGSFLAANTPTPLLSKFKQLFVIALLCLRYDKQYSVNDFLMLDVLFVGRS